MDKLWDHDGCVSPRKGDAKPVASQQKEKWRSTATWPCCFEGAPLKMAKIGKKNMGQARGIPKVMYPCSLTQLGAYNGKNNYI